MPSRRTEVRAEDDSGLDTLWLLKKMALRSGRERERERETERDRDLGCRTPQVDAVNSG